MTFGSLFAGIGGFDLGLEQAGMHPMWQVEIDNFCLSHLKKQWPHVPKYGDVKTIQSLPGVDLVCGGFPCQPFSTAGERRGESDERWLWPEFRRIICLLRPKWVLAENVLGLLSINQGQTFGSILSDLAEIRYDAEWQVLPASAFGAPHQRFRVWIVAYPVGSGLSGPVFQPGIPIITGRTSTKFGNRMLVIGDNWERDYQDLCLGDGISTGMDRRWIKAFGNSVVPHVVEWIGKRIMQLHKETCQ